MKNRLLLFLVLALPVAANADTSGTCGANLTWTYETATQTLTISGSGSMTEYDEWTDNPRLHIGQNFSPFLNMGMTKVVIENGVTTIGSYAFQNCRNIVSVTIPNSIIRFGRCSFSGCSSLSFLTIPDNMNSINDYAFYGCTGLTSISIPSSITTIGNYAFYGCVGLTSLSIPSSITTIGGMAFFGCTNLTSVNISDLEAWCKISFSSTGYANPLIFAKHLYLNGDDIINLEIPNNVIDIKDYSFICYPMKTITIGEYVKSIGFDAFMLCDNFTDVTCFAESVPSTQRNAFESSSIKTATLHVPGSSIDSYKATVPWSDFKKIIPIEGTERTFVLTYKVDGEVYKTYEIKEGEAITSEPNPANREGYTFSGWSKIPEIMPGNDLTITGSFTVNTYTLSYLIDGELYKTKQYTYGASIVPESPVKDGYTFSGWSEIPDIMPANDLTVTGYFSVNTYILTYLIDGELYKTRQYTFDSAIYPEAAPTKKGMSFSGWSEIPDKMPAKNIEVTGNFSWSKTTLDNISYQVTDTIGNNAIVIGCGDVSGEVKIVSTIIFDDTYSVTAINDYIFKGKKNIEKIEICKNITSIGERAFANIDKLTDVTIYAENVPETDRTAFENSYLDYVTLHVPYGSLDAYKSTAPWSGFKEIVPIEGTEPVYVETCAMPTISFVDGKLVFESETVGAECHYEIKVEDAKDGVGAEVALSSTYEITVYASKEGYNDSEKNTATLYWVNVDPISTGVIDNKMTVNANAILVQNLGGVIAISGLADGNDVAVYNISGQLIAQGTASGNSVEIDTNLSSGDICIIKIGDRSVKYMLR